MSDHKVAHFSKSCPKSSHSSFCFKSYVFPKKPQYLRYFCRKNFCQDPSKKLPNLVTLDALFHPISLSNKFVHLVLHFLDGQRVKF